jgi:hypothetical protein
MKFYLKKTARVGVMYEWVSNSFSTKAEAETAVLTNNNGIGDDTVWRIVKRIHCDEDFYDFWLCDTETNEEICCLYSSDGANT